MEKLRRLEKDNPLQDAGRIAIAIAVFAAMFAFWLMNSFTPFNGDDYAYAFQWTSDGASFRRIESLADVCSSQWWHYQWVNGRTIPHVLEQLCAGILGKAVFNVLNVGAFGALLWLVVVFLKGTERLSARQGLALFLLADIAALYLFSFPGQTELWMAGSFNYLWPAVLALFVVRIFLHCPSAANGISGGGGLLLGLVAGWTQEAVSIPFALALLIALVLLPVCRTRGNLLLILGYIIGAGLIILSPGTQARLATNEIKTSGGIVYLFLDHTLNMVYSLYLVPVFWIALCAIILFLARKNRRGALWANQAMAFLLVLWICNAGFLWGLGYGEERVTFALSIVSFLLLGCLFQQPLRRLLARRSAVVLLILLSVAANVYAVKMCRDYHSAYSAYLAAVQRAEDADAVIGMEAYDKPSRFIYIDKVWTERRARAVYLGKKSITLLPPDAFSLYGRLNETFEPIDSVDGFVLRRDLQTGLLFFSCDVARPQRIVERHPVDFSALPAHKRFIRSLLKSQDTGEQEVECSVFPREGAYYYAFHLPSSSRELRLDFSERPSVSLQLP